MNAMKSTMVAALAAVLALAGCATGAKLSDQEKLSLYDSHAGEPVNSFRMVGRLNGWTSLGTTALTVWTRPNEAFLLDVTPCQDLPFAQAITISNFANTVTARFDTVTPIGPGTTQNARFPCRITQIRPIDVKALNQNREEMRQAHTEERAQETPTEGTPADGPSSN